MNAKLRADADKIIAGAINAVKPDEAVRRALANITFDKKVYIVSTGKAGWQMAKAAADCLGGMGQAYEAGVVVTKYDHVMGNIPKMTCFEAGHPVPDENSFKGTRAALDMVDKLTEDDMVLFLLSGGGSALFEDPLITGEELADITSQLLASGADITEMNTIRKRLSGVKGGKFALRCAPAKVETVVLSDIVGDPLDMIASGPAYPDSSSSEDAKRIVSKYGIRLSEKAAGLLEEETPKDLSNVNTQVIGSVRELCRAAAAECEKLGYEAHIISDSIEVEAREAGNILANEALSHVSNWTKIAIIAGGETVVHLTGHGKGGRNQELAFSAMKNIAGQKDMAVFSVGSDGTDGPTDAAGGYVDGESLEALVEAGLNYDEILADNDAYNGLKAIDGLIFTGPTGTNVNDFFVALIG